MTRAVDTNCLRLACVAVAVCVAAFGSVVVKAAGDDAASKSPGHTLYGDPAVPDISGLWLGSFEAEPGDKTQVPVDERSLIRWAPWPPPQTPEYQRKSDERVAAIKAGRPLADSTARCLPFGQPRALTGRVYPDEIIQTPGVVSILAFAALPIMIWTDGRPHPKDLKPSYNGHTIGYWQGNVLYADTVGIVGSGIVDSNRRIVHSDKLHMKTTFELVAPDVMHVHVTLFDEEAFTEPMVTTNIWRRKTEKEWPMLDDMSCWENIRTDTAPAGFKKF